MNGRIRLAVAILTAAGVVGSEVARAQGCVEVSADGTASNRESAIRQAYETALSAVSPGLVQSWAAAGRKLGEAPGYTVRKLTSKCRAGGAGQICQVDLVICKN